MHKGGCDATIHYEARTTYSTSLELLTVKHGGKVRYDKTGALLTDG